MSKKSISLTKEDADYFNNITKALQDIEVRIASLEITKCDLYEEYKKIRVAFGDFAGQLKVKYKVPVDNAIFNDKTNSLEFDDPIQTNEEKPEVK